MNGIFENCQNFERKNWFFCEANPDTLHEEEYVHVYIYIYIFPNCHVFPLLYRLTVMQRIPAKE